MRRFIQCNCVCKWEASKSEGINMTLIFRLVLQNMLSPEIVDTWTPRLGRTGGSWLAFDVPCS